MLKLTLDWHREIIGQEELWSYADGCLTNACEWVGWPLTSQSKHKHSWASPGDLSLPTPSGICMFENKRRWFVNGLFSVLACSCMIFKKSLLCMVKYFYDACLRLRWTVMRGAIGQGLKNVQGSRFFLPMQLNFVMMLVPLTIDELINILLCIKYIINT